MVRQMANLGFETNRFDDLVEEERESTQIALRRLSPKESYDRIYRIRRSVQCSYQHKLLPKDQWTKADEVRHNPSTHPISCAPKQRRHVPLTTTCQDTPYLSEIIQQVEAELAEKDALDTMSVIKRH